MRISSTNQSRFERYAHSEMRKVSSSYPFLDQMIDRIKLDPFSYADSSFKDFIISIIIIIIVSSVCSFQDIMAFYYCRHGFLRIAIISSLNISASGLSFRSVPPLVLLFYQNRNMV